MATYYLESVGRRLHDVTVCVTGIANETWQRLVTTVLHSHPHK